MASGDSWDLWWSLKDNNISESTSADSTLEHIPIGFFTHLMSNTKYSWHCAHSTNLYFTSAEIALEHLRSAKYKDLDLMKPGLTEPQPEIALEHLRSAKYKDLNLRNLDLLNPSFFTHLMSNTTYSWHCAHSTNLYFTSAEIALEHLRSAKYKDLNLRNLDLLNPSFFTHLMSNTTYSWHFEYSTNLYFTSAESTLEHLRSAKYKDLNLRNLDLLNPSLFTHLMSNTTYPWHCEYSTNLYFTSAEIALEYLQSAKYKDLDLMKPGLTEP
ncbi:hypothetical protein J6590_043717 [Homalodisca vitripennis]|nr:hypothetical protein J6590_043717 [Homalodisca vitripennis]